MGCSRVSNTLIMCVNMGSSTLIKSVQIFFKSIFPFTGFHHGGNLFNFSQFNLQNPNHFMLHNVSYITSFHPGFASIKIPQWELSKTVLKSVTLWRGAQLWFFSAQIGKVSTQLYLSSEKLLKNIIWSVFAFGWENPDAPHSWSFASSANPIFTSVLNSFAYCTLGTG